jgi:hypothetical protein
MFMRIPSRSRPSYTPAVTIHKLLANPLDGVRMLMRKTKHVQPLLTALALMGAVTVAPASADIFDISASGRGWVCTPINAICDGNNGALPGNNYFAGVASFTDGSHLAQFRNWFEFAIPTLTGGPLTSATLSLNDGGHNGGPLTFSVYGLSGQPLAFNDVTTSSPYGSVNTTDTSFNTTITITLNAAALKAIGADQGGNIFIGGVDSGENDSPCGTEPPFCDVGDFANTIDMGGPNHFNTVLTLTTTASTVPEPLSAALLATMILLLVGVTMWRRKALSH